MLVLGLLSFFQIVFIPGFIFLVALKIKVENKLEFVMYGFAFSFIINYNLVYFLTLIGIYNWISVYIVFLLEIAAIIFFGYKKRKDLWEPFTDTSIISKNNIGKRILFIITSVSATALFYFFFNNLGSVFTGWDPVFSWNRWAVDWYLNEIPLRTYLYPQLIPANFSISYQFMQEHYVQLFAKAIMPLFAIFISFLFISLYLVRKDSRMLFSSLMFGVVILIFGIGYIDTGYVDIAVAFFSFVAVYETLKSGRLTNKRIAVIILLSSAAALTKFVGFIVFACCLVWILIKIFKRTGSNLFEGRRNIAIITIVSLAALHLHWYIVKSIQILLGVEYSYIRFLTQDIHHDLNLIERFAFGLNRFPLWAIIIFFILAVLIIISLFVKKARIVSIFITIPLILIWGFYFSYDERNLLVALPFMAFSSTYGVSYIIEKILGKRTVLAKDRPLTDNIIARKTILKKIHVVLASILIFTCISIFLLFGYDNIYREQLEKQKKIGNPGLNRLLYDYSQTTDIDGKIITDYYWVTALPGFEGSTIKTFKENDAFLIISNSDSYELVNPMELSDENTFGFLISDIYFSKFDDSFTEKIDEGSFEIIFELGDFHFIKIVK